MLALAPGSETVAAGAVEPADKQEPVEQEPVEQELVEQEPVEQGVRLELAQGRIEFG